MAETLYNAAVAYNVDRTYDGVYVEVATGGNRHSAGWRPQRGRSDKHRRQVEARVSSGTTGPSPARLPPAIQPSTAILNVILAPDGLAAEKAILDFARNKAERQHAQPELAETKPAPSLLPPPMLPFEKMASDEAVAQSHRERAQREYEKRERERLEMEELDDDDDFALIMLMEGE